MELKDLRSKIKDSPHLIFLNEYEFELNFPNINENYKFTGFYNLFKFIKTQKNGWDEILKEDVGSSFSDSVNFFTTAESQVEAFVNYISSAHSEENIRYYLNQNLNRYIIPSNIILTFNCSAVEFLINLFQRNEQLFNPAFNYITGNNINATNKINLYGYFIAYEFENKENSFLFNKRESEKRSFNSLRSELTSFGDDYNNEVSNFIKKVETDYEENTTLQNEKISESRKQLAEWLLHNKTNFHNFLGKTDSDFSTLFDSSLSEFDAIKSQYAEKLKLEEPVVYWNQRAVALNKKANILLICICAVSFVFALLVYCLLWYTPEGLLESLFSNDKSKALRWSFVFIIFISIFFVVIRALLKFMFSNFHLARDAEEREKLTYLYISLLSKGEVSEEERKIVFQALFSRSDTGLLKEDSSPSMPGVSSYIDKIR